MSPWLAVTALIGLYLFVAMLEQRNAVVEALVAAEVAERIPPTAFRELHQPQRLCSSQGQQFAAHSDDAGYFLTECTEFSR